MGVGPLWGGKPEQGRRGEGVGAAEPEAPPDRSARSGPALAVQVPPRAVVSPQPGLAQSCDLGVCCE